MKDFKETKKWLADADAVIVTAGNGFAQMEGLDMFDNLAFPIEYKNISEKYHVLLTIFLKKLALIKKKSLMFLVTGQ